MSSPERGVGASIGWRVLLRLVRALPQGALSRFWGWLARRRLPRPIQGSVNRGFARLFGIELSEAEKPPEQYPSLSGFFARRLRPGVRKWPTDPGVAGSPVDGVLGCFGSIATGRLIQAKGLWYSIADLLGDPGNASRYRHGVFFTIYLSPRHYHRIHVPLRSRLYEARAIPGRLLPVNPAAVRTIPDLFPKNERLVTLHEHEGGAMALVAVGAYNVGSISADFDPAWQSGRPAGVTNRSRQEEVREYEPPVDLARGDELMAFHFGSTVVVLFGPSDGVVPAIHPELEEGREISVGTPLLQQSPSSRRCR